MRDIIPTSNDVVSSLIVHHFGAMCALDIYTKLTKLDRIGIMSAQMAGLLMNSVIADIIRHITKFSTTGSRWSISDNLEASHSDKPDTYSKDVSPLIIFSKII